VEAVPKDTCCSPFGSPVAFALAAPGPKKGQGKEAPAEADQIFPFVADVFRGGCVPIQEIGPGNVVGRVVDYGIFVCAVLWLSCPM
jgi:hypothetical protein